MSLARVWFYLKSTRAVLKKRPVERQAGVVKLEYSDHWARFHDYLGSANSLEEWLSIDGYDRRRRLSYVDGRLTDLDFDASAFYRETIRDELAHAFPHATSATEYGCGVGRNLLFLKSIRPELKLRGYELSDTGVNIARNAAEKFGLDVEYAQLDYLRDSPERYVFGSADVSFTLASLEQLPVGCDNALRNMQERSLLGSIHLEPVIEFFPANYRGWLARVNHRKSGYLQGFVSAVDGLRDVEAHWRQLKSSHHPLYFPTLATLEKRST